MFKILWHKIKTAMLIHYLYEILYFINNFLCTRKYCTLCVIHTDCTQLTNCKRYLMLDLPEIRKLRVREMLLSFS